MNKLKLLKVNHLKSKLLSIIISLFLISCNNVPRLYLAGDSTMADKKETAKPETGWGEMLKSCFSEGIIVDNRAVNGRSTRSFIYESKWDSIISTLKKGDFVVIQFGHNDGVIHKTGRHATLLEYRYNLMKFVNESRQKGAEPILCTPVQRRKFDSTGNTVNTHGKYPGIVRELAKELNVVLIDMQQKSDSIMNKLGVEGSKQLFLHLAPGESKNYPDGKTDNTHFSPCGARSMAKLFIDGLKEHNHKLYNYIINNCNE